MATRSDCTGGRVNNAGGAVFIGAFVLQAARCSLWPNLGDDIKNEGCGLHAVDSAFYFLQWNLVGTDDNRSSAAVAVAVANRRHCRRDSGGGVCCGQTPWPDRNPRYALGLDAAG